MAGLYESFVLFKENEIKKLIVYSLMMLSSLVLSILLSKGIKLVNPTLLIEKVLYLFLGQS